MTFNLGKKIKAMRRLKRFTQEELASALGISVSQLSCIERGAKIPKQEILVTIVTVLDISPYEFFGLNDELKKHAI